MKAKVFKQNLYKMLNNVTIQEVNINRGIVEGYSTGNITITIKGKVK